MAFVNLTHGRLVSDAIDIEGRLAASFATSAVAAQSPALVEALYDVWASQDTYIAVETGATSLTVANGYLVRASNTVTVLVRAGSKISAIAAGAGTLSYEAVG